MTTDPQWLADYEASAALYPGPMAVADLHSALVATGQHRRWREAADAAAAARGDVRARFIEMARASQWPEQLAYFRALSESVERARRMTTAASDLAAVSMLVEGDDQ